jgi:hypothetical protein
MTKEIKKIADKGKRKYSSKNRSDEVTICCIRSVVLEVELKNLNRELKGSGFISRFGELLHAILALPVPMIGMQLNVLLVIEITLSGDRQSARTLQALLHAYRLVPLVLDARPQALLQLRACR